MIRLDKRAFTLVELSLAGVIIAAIMLAACCVLVSTATFYSSSVREAALQDEVTVAARRLLAGEHEGGNVYSLPEAVSYKIRTGTTNDILFTGVDGTIREYFQGGDDAIVYCQCDSSDNRITNPVVIYTAPAGSVLALRFYYYTGTVTYPVPPTMDVGMDITISADINGKQAVYSISTLIDIRNRPA